MTLTEVRRLWNKQESLSSNERYIKASERYADKKGLDREYVRVIVEKKLFSSLRCKKSKDLPTEPDY